MSASVWEAPGGSWAVPVEPAPGAVREHRAWTRRGEAWEASLEVAAPEDAPGHVTELDALVARLAPRDWTARTFASAWGAEFERVEHPAVEGLHVGVRTGRSSHGAHPIVALETTGLVVLVSVAWSGNWRIAIDDGVLRAGVEPHDFFIDLAAGESVVAPSVFVAHGATLADAGAALAAAVGGIIPRSPRSDAMPTEWNHWWPYEDREIDADTFLAESRVAAAVGLEVATLDAGWFGSADRTADWQTERGDWERENTVRFPGGVVALADRVRETGVDFGVWIEAEALGADARARRTHPEIVATRSTPDGAVRITVSLDPDDPTFLGYVCLGSSAGRTFVLDAMEDIVTRTRARWLKLDFNVDPGSGCDRDDHGHGRGDGLFRHYQGLYEVLDLFRQRHPDVVLESCSSGGLRIDLGIAQHVHCHFLSDPDWTEHHLQVLWGASLMLPPAAILHWTWSQWLGDHPAQRRPWAELSEAEFDRSLRAALLHRTGVSIRLTELPAHLRERLATHVQAFRSRIAPLLVDGVLTTLTPPPLREGRGCRQPVFQLDSRHGHLLAAFALDTASENVTLAWRGLQPDARYDVTPLADDEAPFTATGAELRAGTTRRGCSWLWLAVRRADG
ncbi:alpha-galactosidase [Microbacterium sp. TNHR37B]|uniref:alpha-galactosidase n=1 Tax=Microbacterium sp. TNHR37B TaxID=1775956 RepID=UPI0007B2D35F|nr:alpha-galactosidase [Microbacterium sp. TNHR37B]KZE89779.1 Alpha-galactosidase [Microbacterium sp. TNHR37B]